MTGIVNMFRDNDLLKGLDEIGRYVRKSPRTLRRWYKRESFPLCHLPDGSVITSKALIDTWILARNRVERGLSTADLD